MLIIKLLVWCDFTIQSMTVMHPTTNWMGAPCALQVAVVKYKDGHSALASLVRLEKVLGGITYMISSL
jgi:hypothetical protein